MEKINNNNNETIYTITETTVSVNENSNDSVTTYGIECKAGNTTIKRIDDICVNRDALESFIADINQQGLDPIFLRDAIENKMDFLIDPEK